VLCRRLEKSSSAKTAGVKSNTPLYIDWSGKSTPSYGRDSREGMVRVEMFNRGSSDLARVAVAAASSSSEGGVQFRTS
jgi:hypothetical protein